MLGGAFGGWFVAFILIAPALVIAWGVWKFMARRTVRRLAWVLCGIAGLPALSFGILYLIGLPVILIASVLGYILAVSRRLDHVVSAAYIGGYLALGIVVATHDVTRTEWFGIMLFMGSVLAALLAVTKLGHVAGRETWNERRGNTRERAGTIAGN